MVQFYPEHYFGDDDIFVQITGNLVAAADGSRLRFAQQQYPTQLDLTGLGSSGQPYVIIDEAQTMLRDFPAYFHSRMQGKEAEPRSLFTAVDILLLSRPVVYSGLQRDLTRVGIGEGFGSVKEDVEGDPEPDHVPGSREGLEDLCQSVPLRGGQTHLHPRIPPRLLEGPDSFPTCVHTI